MDRNVHPVTLSYVKNMEIQYTVNDTVSVDEFLLVLQESGLGERRPIDDLRCLAGMLHNANLIVTARVDGALIGIARAVTDFHYACYLSDLAVAKAYQHKGVGIELQRRTQAELGPHCKLILIAAPQANTYYPKIGYINYPTCWVLPRDQQPGKSSEQVE